MRIENPFRLGFIATIGVLTAPVLGGMVASLSTILTYIGAALFLALGFEPIIAFLERHRWPRWAAIISSLGGAAIALGLVVWALIPSIATQVEQLSVRYSSIVNDLAGSNVIEWVDERFPDLQAQEFVTDALEWLRNNLATIGGGVLEVGFGIVNAFFGVLIVFILMLYFVSSMNSIKRGFYQLLPASKRARTAELTEQITASVGKFVLGQVALGLANGILSFTFLSIIGASMPAVFALIAFLGSLIPLVGTLSASVIIVLLQLALMPVDSSVWWMAAIYYVIYMQVEAYVISPRIMSSAVQVPGAIVVIAALTGGTLLGLLGALVAIPIAAAILLIVKQVWIPSQNER